MSVSESQRRDIFVKLEEAHGEDVANSIMQLLPRLPHDELATREDLAATTSVLRGEMAELRGEMARLAAELRGEMAELRAELRGELAQLRGDTQRWMAGIVAANAVAVVTALVT